MEDAERYSPVASRLLGMANSCFACPLFPEMSLSAIGVWAHSQSDLLKPVEGPARLSRGGGSV